MSGGIRDITWDEVADSISDPIFIADSDNNIVKANISFARLFKKKIEDVVGKKCYEVVHKSAAPFFSCPFEKSKKDGKIHVEEVDDPNIGVPILVTTSPIFDKSGKMVGVVHVSKDISGVKNTENELKDKIVELERFQKITIDRELKMKELKAKIARLESMISDNK